VDTLGLIIAVVVMAASATDNRQQSPGDPIPRTFHPRGADGSGSGELQK
jgi:hypothetical protein